MIEQKVNKIVTLKIAELKMELQKDEKRVLNFPCTIKAFREHFSEKGKPMRPSTFTAWRRRGWVECTGRMVLSINKAIAS